MPNLRPFTASAQLRAISASGRDEVAGLLVREEPNLVILDLRLGQEDGLDLLREIRSRSDVPVIITTGHPRDEIDRVVGLELGADDYITKPFGLRELLARIQAVLRRREAGQAAVQRDQEKGRCRFTLVINCAHDQIVTQTSELAARIPGSKCRQIRAGHLAYFEGAEEFLSLAAEFLRGA
jgi:DNA-binding response OmpR family regulator